MFLYQAFADKRKALGFKQSDVAQLANTTTGTIKLIETGRAKASQEMAHKLCHAIGVTPDDYITKQTFVLTFLSNKGGSCKTTNAVHIAYNLAVHHHKKVLLIDADFQQNSGDHLGMQMNESHNFYFAMFKKVALVDCVMPTQYANLDFISSHDGLSLIDSEMALMELREFRVKDILRPLVESGVYDYILFDTNPSLGLFNRSILYATNGIIVPFVAAKFGLRGVEYLTRFVEGVQANHDELKILGIMVSNYYKNKRISTEIMNRIDDLFENRALLFDTKIPTDTMIELAQDKGEVVEESFSKSRAQEAYLKLSYDVIKRAEKMTKEE